jgi:hypothetical protein
MLLIWASLLLPLVTISGSARFYFAPNELLFPRDADPKLVGDENLCILFGSVIGEYSAGGDSGDVYDWVVTDAGGQVILERSGGQAETIQVVFPAEGQYTVRLKVRRGTNADFYNESLTVIVSKGPEIALLPDYLLCAGAGTLLTALDPTTPNLSEYTIEWKNIDGDILGTGNEYLTYAEGYHLVDIYQTDPSGNTSCTIDGSTFVGPPIDFQIIPSATTLCEGSTIDFGLDTPISGEWFVQKGLTGDRRSLGNAFLVSQRAGELSEGPGVYYVSFQATSEDFPGCVSERYVAFELVESPKITATAVSRPSDCSVQNGSFQITVDGDIDALHIPELDITEGPLSAGQTLTYENLDSKVYTLELEKQGCKVIKLFTLEAEDPATSPSPPVIDLPSIVVQPETCSPSGVAPGMVTLDFGGQIAEGEYRILQEGRGLITRGTISENEPTQIDLRDGKYLLEMKISDCNYPVQEITIENAPQVQYTIPQNLNICESYEFTPETSQNLNFTLTFPDGSEKSISSGQSFTLTEAGAYSIVGTSLDPSSNLCPRKYDFEATFSSNISFSPILSVEECFAPIRYEIELEGITPDQAGVRWYNSEGEIVGRGLEFYPPAIGFYSLLVQPLQSGYCPAPPVNFEVVAPITSVEVEMSADFLCPDPGISTVTVDTDTEIVANTQWIFYDLQDVRSDLPGFEGFFEIEVNQPGTYEVVLLNDLGCEIGRELIVVEASQLTSEPALEESYGVCSRGDSGHIIDPGEYAEYYWYREERLVSEEPTFIAKEVGNYSLRVVTADGCEFTGSFRTYDACTFSYVFPNAMVLGDPQRAFEVRVSEGITEAELFIINRQGALVHHSVTTEIAFGQPILPWDGTSGGKNIPAGTYVVVLIGRNPQFQFEEKITGSLLVLE